MLPLPLDTRRALGLREDGESAVGVDACESRSLLCDRYANPQLKEADRNAFFAGVAKRRAWTNKCSAWPDFLSGGLGLKPDGLLFAQLRSRLLVNMAGGVMENAGLCLDRFGVPYVPGSAVKGCARRMAIQRLLEEREAGRRPHELAALLVNIALVVGWGDTDWKAGRRQGKNGRKGELHSDFEFACGEGHSWRSVRDLAVPILLEKLAVQPQRSPRE
ncbi:MAG: hypothetical protein FJ387_27545, partial [Verrucomicrobia bacterium]|nr:hypothetical protein [Verrucomicrobiota bacterium]